MLTRRHFIARSLGGIATVYAWHAGVLVPTGTAHAAPAAQTNPFWEARHGLSIDDFQALVDWKIAQGCRPTDVSGYEEFGKTKYTPVWDGAPFGGEGAARHGLSSDAYQSAFDELGGLGFRL